MLPSLLIFVFYGLSLGFLGLALKKWTWRRLRRVVRPWDSLHSVGGRLVVPRAGERHEDGLARAHRGGGDGPEHGRSNALKNVGNHYFDIRRE